MIEYILWFISFVSLFVSLVWLSTFYLSKPDLAAEKKVKIFPKVTIGVPAYNEEKGITKTLKSLLELDYPPGQLEIIVVDDGSTDNTRNVVGTFLKEAKEKRIILFSQKNRGKGAALNAALRKASGELFGCVDADSTVAPDSLKKIVQHFSDEKVGAVVSTIRVEKEKNFLQKLQRYEYIISSFFRKLFTSMEALYITPGVLSVYRKSVILRLGGFDEGNITEDLEMGLRLNYNKYKIVVEMGSRTYTEVPATISAFWNQRIRWLRGHIHNIMKYKGMILNPEYGFIGMFQLPLHVFSPVLMLLSAGIISYGLADRLYWLALRLSVAPYSVLNMTVPPLREMIFSLKLQILFPLFVIIALGVYLYSQAHRYLRENWMFPLTFVAFLMVYPAVISYVWIVALIEESLRVKRRW